MNKIPGVFKEFSRRFYCFFPGVTLKTWQEKQQTSKGSFDSNSSHHPVLVVRHCNTQKFQLASYFGEGVGEKTPCPQPIPYLPVPPFLEQLPFSHSFTPFLKISTQPPPFGPRLQKEWGRVRTVINISIFF